MDFPKVNLLHVELTNACNFHCEFCPLTVSARPPKSMPLAMFKMIVDDIAQHGLASRIQLHVLGEPLLYRDILAAIRHATDKGLKVMLTTNGSLLTPDLVLALADAGLYSVDISLQLCGDSGHALRHTGMDYAAYYQRILDACATLHTRTDMQLIVKLMNTKYKPLFTLAKPFTPDQRGREFKALVSSLATDIARVIGSPLQGEDIARRLKKVNLDSSKRIRLASRLFIHVQLFMDWGNAFNDGTVYPAKFGACSFAFTSPSVLCDGSVSICCGDFDGGTRLGNVAKTPLHELLRGPAAQRLWAGFRRNRFLHPYCQRCMGGRNPLLSLIRGLGSVAVAKFMRLQGENVVALD